MTAPALRPGWSALERRLAILLLFAGAALRLLQYLSNRSLWLDEAALARNILDRSPWRLVSTPLDYVQTATPGFLLAEKLVATLAGGSEYALRFIPLVLGLISLPLFFAVARRLLPPAPALVALAMFAFSGRLIYYASEVKQYGPDVTVALLFVWLMLTLREHGFSRWRTALMALAGAIAPWFSQPAIFILAAAGLALVSGSLKFAPANFNEPDTGPGAVRWRDQRGLLHILVLCVVWAMSSLVAVLVARRSLGAFEHEYMRSFWGEAGFIPYDAPLSLLRWPLDTVIRVLRDPFGSPVPPLAFAAIALGAAWLRKRDRIALALLALPLAFLLAAVAVRAYPLGTDVSGFTKIGPARGRLLLFLLPAAFVVAAAGVAWLRERGGVRARILAPLLAAALVVPPLYYAAAELPRRPEDVRPLLERVAREARPGDLLWVFYGAAQQYRYYASRGAAPPVETTIGACERPYWRRYLSQVDSLAGRGRVWLLFSHPASVDGVHEGALLRGYLDRRARRVAEHGEKEAYLLLYDFSDTPRVASAATSARTTNAPRVLALAERCVGVFDASR